MTIKILGAGLSGLCAGIKLAQAGEKVQISEKKAKFGSKFSECVHAIRNYENGVDELDRFRKNGLKLTDFNPIKKIYKYAPSLNYNLVYSTKKPLFYTFKRGSDSADSIDNQLREQTVKEGVNVVANNTYSFGQSDIVATGPLFHNSMGFGAHYTDLDIDSDTIHFFSDNRYAPQGYACVMPFGRKEATVLTTTFDVNSFSKMYGMFHKLISENKIIKSIVDGGTKVNEHSGVIFYNVPQSAHINGKYFLGEAAGFSDASRGFGTSYAISSALLASQAILNKESYDALWKNQFGDSLMKSFKVRLAMQRFNNEKYEEEILRGKKEMTGEEYSEAKKERNTNYIKNFLIDKLVNSELEKWKAKYDISRFV